MRFIPVLARLLAMMPRFNSLTFADVARLASRLPDVEVSIGYDTPALKVKGKRIARRWEDGDTLRSVG